MPVLNEIVSCEVCGASSLKSVLDLGFHAMCDDLVTIGDKTITEKYPIKILFCSKCVTAHQQFQIPKVVLFPETYHYRAALTKDVLNGMGELADSCESIVGSLENKTVLDVGCNDGSLLSILKGKGARTFGVEPTNAALEAKAKGHEVIQAFFEKNVARDFVENHGQPDLVTFTNVFAHIENLGEVLAALELLMHPTTCLVIENHYLGAVLEKNQFDTFYHEHPRTYSYTSFKFIAHSLNAQIVAVEFPKRYGGNIRVFISRSPIPTASEIDENALLQRETLFLKEFSNLSSNLTVWKTKKRTELLREVAKHGRLRAKAFPGRAAILLELLNLSEQHISAVYEQPGSPKVGSYIPGTRIPILSDDSLDLSDELPILNLAWHIHDEIALYLKKLGYRGVVIPIAGIGDFTE